MIAAGRVIAQNFTLERVLAHGGMGSVWVAHDERLDRRVAIKFMNPDSPATAAARARFEREARAAAKLQSPHVVQIHSHGHDAGALYIVMELLEGEDLEARLQREGRLPARAVSELARQAAKALAVAHAAGIVHRDLKPANIFLSRTGEDEVLKLLDFGVAKVVSADDEVSHTGDVFGSPHYLSPEQARGRREVDHRTDLWSLGVILFRAVSGKLPFDGSWIGEIIDGICSGKVPSACASAPDLRPEVDAFFTRALARSADERFQSAKEMASAFAEAAGLAAAATTDPPPPASSDAPPSPLADLPTVAAVPAALAAQKELDDTPAHGTRTLAPGRGASARVLWASGAGAALVVGAIGFLLVSRSRAPASQEPVPAAAPRPAETALGAPSASASDAVLADAVASAEPAPSAAPSAPGARAAPPSAPQSRKPHATAAPSGPKRLPLSY